MNPFTTTATNKGTAHSPRNTYATLPKAVTSRNETEYALIGQVAQAVPVEQVNKCIQDMIGDTNIVISLTGPEKEGLSYPTDEELLRDFMKAQQIPVEPYRETLSDEPLIPSLPAPGKITESKEDPLFGATVLTLSNGIKVVLKLTDFKKDEIQMTATSREEAHCSATKTSTI